MKRAKSLGKSRKAVVEVQFNWVFVLIAGALILAFFILIISKQKAVSDKKLSIGILNSMDKVMSSQKTSENRQDLIPMFEVEMSYSCGGCDCSFSLAGMSKSKGNLVVFAPTSTRSDRILTWTQSWDMPFRVTNFVYMSVPEIKYYFISPTPAMKRDFIDELPVNLSVEVVNDLDSITYKGEQKIRLVFFSNDDSPPMPTGLETAEDASVTALVITGSGSSSWYNGQATLKFFRKKGIDFVPDKDEEDITNEYPVLGLPSAYGAVYSDSFQNYWCNMNDALKRLAYVSLAYKIKSERMNYDLDDAGNSVCAFYQGFGAVAIGDIINYISPLQPTSLFNSISILDSYNEGAIVQSCPRIY